MFFFCVRIFVILKGPEIGIDNLRTGFSSSRGQLWPCLEPEALQLLVWVGFGVQHVLGKYFFFLNITLDYFGVFQTFVNAVVAFGVLQVNCHTFF